MVDCCRVIAKQTNRRVMLKDQGAAELRSSVNRVNGKNASPARRKKKEGQKELKSCWVKRGSIYRHARAT